MSNMMNKYFVKKRYQRTIEIMSCNWEFDIAIVVWVVNLQTFNRISINDKWFLFSQNVLISILSHRNYSTSSLLFDKFIVIRWAHCFSTSSLKLIEFKFSLHKCYSILSFSTTVVDKCFFFVVVYCCFVWFYVRCVFFTFFCQISFYSILFQFIFSWLSIRIRFEFLKTINCLFCYRLSIFQI